MRKVFVTFSLTKPRENVEVVLKNSNLFNYGEVHYIANSMYSNVTKISTPYAI